MAIDTARAKENAAGGYTAAATHASAHTADPAGTGAGEVTGGSPAYARKPITWNAGAVDGVYTSDLIEFDIPAATTLTHVGAWTALTAGTYLDKTTVAATFTSQGKFRVVLTYTQS